MVPEIYIVNMTCTSFICVYLNPAQKSASFKQMLSFTQYYLRKIPIFVSVALQHDWGDRMSPQSIFEAIIGPLRFE